MKEKRAHSFYLKAPLFLAYSLFLLPILPNILGNVLIGLFVLSCILSYYNTKNRRFNLLFFLAMSGLYLCYALSLIYTQDLSYGLRKMGTAIPLVLFPLAFSFLNPKLIALFKAHLRHFIKCYVGAVGLLGILILIKCYDPTLGWQQKFDPSISILGQDMLYLSMHLALGSLSAVYLFYLSKKIWKGILAVIIIICFFILLLIISFKSTILAFLVAFGIYALMVNKAKLWSLFISSTIVLIGLISFSTEFNQRFTELLVIKDSADMAYNEVKDTVKKCSVDLVPKAGLWGYGIGDGKKELLDCYAQYNSDLEMLSYNSHNQYLSILIHTGFLGILAFGIMMFALLFMGLNSKNYLGIAFLILFAMFMTAENILERQHGVIYFSLLINFLFASNFTITKPKHRELSHEEMMDALQ